MRTVCSSVVASTNNLSSCKLLTERIKVAPLRAAPNETVLLALQSRGAEQPWRRRSHLRRRPEAGRGAFVFLFFGRRCGCGCVVTDEQAREQEALRDRAAQDGQRGPRLRDEATALRPEPLFCRGVAAAAAAAAAVEHKGQQRQRRWRGRRRPRRPRSGQWRRW